VYGSRDGTLTALQQTLVYGSRDGTLTALQQTLVYGSRDGTLTALQQTLVYGSRDGGRTVLARDAGFNALMKRVAQRLNIKGHRVGQVRDAPTAPQHTLQLHYNSSSTLTKGRFNALLCRAPASSCCTAPATWKVRGTLTAL
jgi:hypothetical protein